MIYVGIDITKLNHFASFLSSNGQVLLEPFRFTNDNDGFQKLIASLSCFDKEHLIIGLKSAAHYGNILAPFLIFSHLYKCYENKISCYFSLDFS